MPGAPYFGADGRPRIQTNWSTLKGSSTQTLEFILDSGATRSGVDKVGGIGGTFLGTVGVIGASGVQAQYVLLGDTTMEFDVVDTQQGTVRTVTHTGQVLITGQRIIGQEVFQAKALSLTMDFTVTPPAIRLEC